MIAASQLHSCTVAQLHCCTCETRMEHGYDSGTTQAWSTGTTQEDATGRSLVKRTRAGLMKEGCRVRFNLRARLHVWRRWQEPSDLLEMRARMLLVMQAVVQPAGQRHRGTPTHTHKEQCSAMCHAFECTMCLSVPCTT
jgi:hypothetical protein